jgi:transcriptional regulator with XRE-family HTH domain
MGKAHHNSPLPFLLDRVTDLQYSNDMTPEQFHQYLEAQVLKYGSQKALAQHCGVGQAYLSDVLRGNREPGFKIVAALGFKKVVTYERLEEDER